jgi:phosphatidylglycerophosphatase A
MRALFLTFFYTGKSPFAPGTVGTLAGALLAILILEYFPLETLFLASILLSILGIRSIDSYEKDGGEHDDKSIVIDEVVGVWLALSISLGATQVEGNSSAALGENTWILWLASIVLFRVFDIWKPSIIGRIDAKVKGGLGVMGDDIVAGAIAGIAASMCYGVALKFGFA